MSTSEIACISWLICIAVTWITGTVIWHDASSLQEKRLRITPWVWGGASIPVKLLVATSLAFSIGQGRLVVSGPSVTLVFSIVFAHVAIATSLSCPVVPLYIILRLTTWRTQLCRLSELYSVRNWSDAMKSTSMLATFLKLVDGVVYFQRQDGRECTVAMARLHSSDQELIQGTHRYKDWGNVALVASLTIGIGVAVWIRSS